ncbi:MAG: UMP kinase [Candidatus Paceibacterota bacterium]|jgi:uridylate kinase|nr:UMP kinase [Candidatus Paceibacterota bacterium]
MKNKRILLKLSGEALAGKTAEQKYSEEMFEDIADQIKKLQKKKVEIGIVVGGGNLFRGRDLSGLPGVKRMTADYIGMLGTVQNSLVLRDYFESVGMEARVSSAIGMRRVCAEMMQAEVEEHLSSGRIVIFAAGLGAAYFSTDSNAVQRSLEIGADMLVMAKNGVDGIYTADPKTDKNAKKIDRLKAIEVLQKNLKVADASAVALAKEHGLTIKVCAMDAITEVFSDKVGSVIEPN